MQDCRAVEDVVKETFDAPDKPSKLQLLLLIFTPYIHQSIG